jgi:hypothetical protein
VFQYGLRCGSARGEGIASHRATRWASCRSLDRSFALSTTSALSPRRRRLALVGWHLLGVVALGASPYLIFPAYDFPPPTPFHGTHWYNPYDGATAPWQMANFHAHSRAWGGVTNGRQQPNQVIARYASLGYALPTLSNYLETDTIAGTLAVYEHGLNLTKAHALVIGARRVDWLDFPLGQGIQHTQFLLNRLSADGEVAITHPYLRGAHSLDDMARLAGYDLLEVVSHFGCAEAYWDAALSAGRPIWGIGGDDTHNASDARQTGRMWTLVSAASLSRDDVLAALRAGRTITVRGRAGRDAVAMRTVAMRGDTLSVELDRHVERIEFIGQQGRLLARTSGDARASFVVPAGEPYVRTVVRDAGTTLFLNPVVRTAGGAPLAPVAFTNTSRTWTTRVAALVLVLAVITGLRSRAVTSRMRRRALTPVFAMRRFSAADL